MNMKKIIILSLPVILFACNTLKMPRHNTKSKLIKPKYDINSEIDHTQLSSEFKSNLLSNNDFNNPTYEKDDLLKDDINIYNSDETSIIAVEKSFEMQPQKSEKINLFRKKSEIFHNDKFKQQKKKKIANKTRKNNNNQSNGTRIGLIIGGIGLVILSLVVIWYASILGGALMLIGGLTMWIVGGIMPKPDSQRGSSNKPKTEVQYNDMVDVVYLKNGGVRRGLIIEQIPGESLKIKTNDGSVYVFKMDEIAKITKE